MDIVDVAELILGVHVLIARKNISVVLYGESLTAKLAGHTFLSRKA